MGLKADQTGWHDRSKERAELSVTNSLAFFTANNAFSKVVHLINVRVTLKSTFAVETMCQK